MKRVKRRYLALQIYYDGAFNQREFLNTLWSAITRLYGEYGASQTGLALIDFSEEHKTAIIRISLETLQQVRASLVSITQIASKEAAIYVLAISGTIKSLRKNSLLSELFLK